MFKDRSILRYGIDRYLRGLAVPPGRVLDLGGKRNGYYSAVFRGKGCSYLAVGFEGDVSLDIGTATLPFENASFDFVFVSTVLMYLDEVGFRNVLREAALVLTPGGTLLIAEPFLATQTHHRGITDRRRWTHAGMCLELEASGFGAMISRPISGIFGMGFTVLRDLLPGFLSPVRTLCTLLGAAADGLSEHLRYFRVRNARYYQGYIVSAVLLSEAVTNRASQPVPPVSIR